MTNRERLTALLMAGAGDCLGKGGALNCSRLADYLLEHGVNEDCTKLKDQPTADMVEVRRGKWIETQEPLGWCDVDCAECSVCHESWIIDEDSSIDEYECIWHYCPNCGAKMDGGNNNG